MADAYWAMYGDGRNLGLNPALQTAVSAPVPVVKRPRSDIPDMAGGAAQYSGHAGAAQYSGHAVREDGRIVVRDVDSVGASYDQYLRNGIQLYGGGDPARQSTGGLNSRPVDDPRLMGVTGVETHGSRHGNGRPDMPLPPDASSTLYVEGLPADCTRREVSHIFRPFVGFREVRLVMKGSKHPGGNPLMLCFVDFSTPNQAAFALDALQGYKLDESIPDTSVLRLQFARFPPRSGGPGGPGGPPRGRH